MKFFYDLEFIQDGWKIDLVSIGIVNELGDEMYAISQEFSEENFLKQPWLIQNVLPSLPFVRAKSDATALTVDYDHPDRKLVWPRWRIADEVKRFLIREGHTTELWGYYSAYDHVCLMQLFGPMSAKPEPIPMWTNDIQQEAVRLGVADKLPEQTSTVHNALEDARWNKEAWEFLNLVAQRRNR